MFSKVVSLVTFASAILAAPAFNVSTAAASGARLCGVSVTSEQIAAHNAEFQAILAAKGETLESYALPTGRVTGTVERLASVVNVYWHVVYSSTSISKGYIPDSQIADQIAVLNADYASVGIKFQLAGTDRTLQSTWFNKASPGTSYQTAMKKALRKGAAADLNVYSVGFNDGSGLLGYSTFPSDYKSNPKDDGVVILYSSVPGGTASPYNLGRTLTHEAGHWFGLYHVFDDNQTSCSDYDLVSDTPPQKTPSFGCPTGKDTCTGGGVDSIHNYMDYTDDDCMTQFSTGQGTRMAAQVATYRGLA